MGLVEGDKDVGTEAKLCSFSATVQTVQGRPALVFRLRLDDAYLTLRWTGIELDAARDKWARETQIMTRIYGASVGEPALGIDASTAAYHARILSGVWGRYRRRVK